MTNKIKKEFLIRKFTLVDEKDFVITNDVYYKDRALTEPVLHLPFGYENDKWETMKALVEDGDELWQYSTPEWTWGAFVGCAGIVLLRNDDIIAEFVTERS